VVDGQDDGDGCLLNVGWVLFAQLARCGCGDADESLSSEW
jgi:hypothetical protein